MAYTEKQKKLRRCKVVKANGEQCRSYSKIGFDRCALHLYDHKTKVLPKANEREAARIRREKRRAQGQKEATCTCSAYPFIHRLSSGFCRYPDPPAFRLVKPFKKKTSSPGVEQSERINVIGSGEDFYWERIVTGDDSTSVQNGEDELPNLDSEQVPQDREERGQWNARKLKRLIEQESLNQRQAADDQWHY
jgi:hypothetical protein